MEKEQRPEINPSREREDVSQIISELRSLKDDWRDEIPSEIIRGGHVDRQEQMYKCRKNWWAALVIELYEGVLPLLNNERNPELIRKIYIFFDDYCGEEFKGSKGRLTTKEDIERANELIKEVIETLEKSI